VFDSLWVISPVYWLVEYLDSIYDLWNIQFPWFMGLFVFYWIGLILHENREFFAWFDRKKASAAMLILFLLSVAEGRWWLSLGNSSMAMSQAKFSSYGYAASVLFVLFALSRSVKRMERKKHFISACLKKVGDCSYGIFYVHCFVLSAMDKILFQKTPLFYFSAFWYCLLLFALTVAGSLILICIAKKLLGDQVAKYLGLV
jgi:peptidoglycan/LPS O-acetylase OafA/YrhL